jgi:DNA primase
MTYREACDYLGREPRLSLLPGGGSPDRTAWEPRTCASPGDLWQRQARKLVDDAVYELFSPRGKVVHRFLREERGLNEDTIKTFSLGWLPADRWDAAPAWGLTEILKDNGVAKKMWFPTGLTIPHIVGGQVRRVRIRRPEGEPRYYILRGSSTQSMLIGGHHQVTVLVESELDGMILSQEAGDLVGLVALGNAQARPDQEAADLLKRSRLILVALDADPAGAREAWRWWMNHYSQARRWPPIQGKDPGEMFSAGVKLRAWVQAGLLEYGEAHETG